MSRIHLSPPDVRPLERELLLEAVDSGWIAPVGPHLDAFEREVAERAQRGFAVGLSSGTAALHLALVEMGVGPGDDVLVPTFTFVASANAIRYVGATPVFIDSEEATWNLSSELLAEELEQRSSQGQIPKAAVVVDLYGQCAQYERIVPILREHGILLVEDAAEALGASRDGRAGGSFGHCAALSFNGNKLVTTSGGGMLLTDDEAFAGRIRHLATQARQPAAHYEHLEVGYNYRLSNLLAAFGLGQLRCLQERIARRRQIHDRYSEVLSSVDGIEFAPIDLGNEPNWWLTCLTIDSAAAGFTSEDLRMHLEAADIESRPLWKPMHLQPVFAGMPSRVDGTSERLFETGVCLPSGSGMSDAQLDRVISEILSCVASGRSA